MRPGRVRAGDEHAVRLLEIVIAGGRRVGAQALLVAHHGGRHAQARIAVDVVGADQAARQLVERVIVLGQQLAGDVETDRVRPVFGADGRQLVGDARVGRVPAQSLGRCSPLGPPRGLQQAARLQHHRRRGQVQGRALGAQPPEVRRMLGVAAHAGDLRAIAFNDDPAADTAIGAGGARLSQKLPPSPNIKVSRMSATVRPSRTSLKYQLPSAVSPYRQAPTSTSSLKISFL